MKNTLTVLLFTIIALPLLAQKKDRDAIKSMCGCYSITFDYAETFSPDANYDFHPPYQASARAEWIFVDEEDNDRIVIQHLLVMRDTMIIKHWRQDWLHANTNLHQYIGNRKWEYSQLPKNEVRRQWTQKVYQVDDSPRYQGSATWIHSDGKHYWENTTDSPLPRREFSKRDDYNVMERTNRHQLTEVGWLHEQDNRKLLRKNGRDQLIAEEKGINQYTKIDDKYCKAAKLWWEDKKDFWRLVRAEWGQRLETKEDITILNPSNKVLWKELFALEAKYEYLAKTDPEKTRTAINALLNEFVISGSQEGELQTAQMKP